MLDEHGAITDAFAKERPEAANLVTIYARLGRQSLTDVLNELAGKSFSDFKGMLTDRAVDQMAPIGSEMQRLMNDPAHIDAVLKTVQSALERLRIPSSTKFTISSVSSARKSQIVR